MHERSSMRWLIACSCVLSVVMPLIVWFDLEIPGRTVLAVACTLMVPGVPLAVLLIGRPVPVLWVLIPALSISAVILVTVAQIVAGLWSPPVTATLLALVNVGCSAAAWQRTTPMRWSGADRPRLNTFRVLAAIALGGAGTLWRVATNTVDLDTVGATGLAAVLPWPYWAAVGIACLVACLAILRRPGPDGLIAALGIACLAIMIVTFVGVVDGGSPVGTAYVHVGFIDWIAETGTLREAMDARFSWPGFFTAATAVMEWAGLPDATPLVVLFPVVALLLCFAPVYVIGKAVFGSRTVAWTGVLLFVLGNWVQQDYFAPQAIAFPLMLSVIAVLLWQLGETGVPGSAVRGWRRLLLPLRRTPARLPGMSAGGAVALELALFVIACAIVVSHQLTPVTLIVTLMLWSLLGVIRARTLWFGVAVAFAGWFAFGAEDWWSGHLSVLLTGFGQVREAVGAGVVARVSGDPTYQVMQQVRIAWSALFALAGFAGWLVTRGGRLPMPVSAVLVIAPVSLVLGQPYGGEVILRVYLYALPILAVLAAGLIAPLVRARARIAGAAFILMMLGATAQATVARGVNTAFERTPADVLVAARDVLWQAETGSTVRPLATEGALRVARIGDLYQPPPVEGDGTALERLLQQDPDVVFLTSMREQYEHITAGAEADWYRGVAQNLEASGRYRITDRTAHVTVLQRVGETAGGSAS